MGEITGALIGIAVVVSAVFLPMTFFGGSVGVIYRQFSVTIIASMALSVVVAIVLIPALCARFLKAGTAPRTRGFLGAFNRRFDAAQGRYVGCWAASSASRCALPPSTCRHRGRHGRCCTLACPAVFCRRKTRAA
jgi:multidrug efflux pump subunit AcrB